MEKGGDDEGKLFICKRLGVGRWDMSHVGMDNFGNRGASVTGVTQIRGGGKTWCEGETKGAGGRKLSKLRPLFTGVLCERRNGDQN